MSSVIETELLTKRYRRRAALADCTLQVPAGRVVGLVGPNGAGKTTLLHLAVGLLAPSSGRITVLGREPGEAEALSKVGFVAQDTPVYPTLTVGEHLRLGAWTNPRFDTALAASRTARLGLDPRQRAGKLSGGQRAQLALTLAVAKRPRLLVLDEPVASLDPLARREFLAALADVAQEADVSILLSSHLVGDLEQVCDEIVVLVASRVQVAGPIDRLLASHRLLAGPPGRPAELDGASLVEARDTAVSSILLVKDAALVEDPAWTETPASLEDLVLGYMSRAGSHAPGGVGAPLATLGGRP
ncbi:MAG TPA: ABC transporter ATP-binding protein [Acidimicrobiales bacterium]|nr:ABC transporter ATP-binding protein [Acidimicrobiales bacterium]